MAGCGSDHGTYYNYKVMDGKDSTGIFEEIKLFIRCLFIPFEMLYAFFSSDFPSDPGYITEEERERNRYYEDEMECEMSRSSDDDDHL